MKGLVFLAVAGVALAVLVATHAPIYPTTPGSFSASRHPSEIQP